MNRPNRVLAAEDSATQAAALRSHLEEAGFDVTLTTNGDEALAAVRRQSYDLVVSDVVMPGIDGYELCRSIKEHNPEIPVVLLTSMRDPLDVVNALAAGADNFLRKPYQQEELVHRIRNMLYNKALRQEGRAQIGLELFFLGRRFMINSDREQILDLLISTFEELVSMNEQLRDREDELARLNDEIRLRLQQVELEQGRLRGVLTALPEGLVVVDSTGRIVDCNESLGKLVGLDDTGGLAGTPVWDAVSLSDHVGNPIDPTEIARHLGETLEVGHGFDLFVERPDGHRTPVIVRTAPILDRDGHPSGTIGVLHDIAALTNHDPVTGLPGHAILVDRLNRLDDEDTSTTNALLVVVIDRFERLREALTSAGAEAALAAVVSRLKAALQSDRLRSQAVDVLASHLGNGDLAIVLSGISDEAEAVLIGEVLADELSGPIEVRGVDAPITVSIAVGIWSPAVHAAELVASVAASARDASNKGGSRIVTSDPAMHASVMERMRQETELRHAIATDQLVAHYQPQVRLRGDAPIAVEALVRWQHPQRGLLGAGEIIPLAIESGLIGELSWAMISQSCQQVQRWREELPGAQNLMLSVNVAAEQLDEARFMDRLRAVLDESSMEPTALILELTETSMLRASDPIEACLKEIKRLGIQIAVDDFGTGYSSLLQLRELPIDIIKIDRGFVAGMIDEPADAAIVGGTVSLARALGLEVVAEGVETIEQLVQLRVLGCDAGQGYLWTRPAPAAELERWWIKHGERVAGEDRVNAPIADLVGGSDDTVAYIVHELRSPLTAISGYAHLLSETTPSGEGARYIDAIARNARALESTLALVDEARVAQRGGIALEPTAVDLAEFVTHVLEDLAGQLGDHPVQLHVAEPGTISADPGRLRQALTNLLTNAAKFSPPGSPIDVSVTDDDGHATISVRDRGPGIPAHRRPELFRRFSRLGSKSRGMGVGLYLARLIVDAHGGNLRYDPAPEGGSVFTIRLPKADAIHRAALPGGGAAEESGPPDADARRQPVSVLYIEDNLPSAELVTAVLGRRRGLTLHLATDGTTGIELAVTHRPDLILLDLNLPDLPGEEVLRRLRDDPRTRDIRVVIASADTTPDRLAAAQALGGVEILPKPLNLARLVRLTEESRTTHRAESTIPSADDADGRSQVLDPGMVTAIAELAQSSSGSGVQQAVDAYVTDSSELVDTMRAAIEQGDPAQLAYTAHMLAGSSANFGARTVARWCQDLELGAKKGDLNDARDLVERIADAVAQAVSALEDRLGRS